MSISQCRTSCTSAVDCTGATQCELVAPSQSVCLNPDEVQKTEEPKSDDQSFGISCDGDPGACGENAPLCNAAVEQNTGNYCTVACNTGLDSECQTNLPLNCTDQCALNYANSCCIPNDPTVPPGAITSGGAKVATYCRSTATQSDNSLSPNWCFFFAQRCATPGDACPGVRTGRCQPSGDGGACTLGTRGLYECCTRDGQCDTSHGLICLASFDGVSNYCSGGCSQDSDCTDPNKAVVGASCWTNTYLFLGTQNNQSFCLVMQNAQPSCHTETVAAPCGGADANGNCNAAGTPLTAAQAANVTSDQSTWGGQVAIPCNVSDRPSTGFADNAFCASLQTCVNPTDPTAPTCN